MLCLFVTASTVCAPRSLDHFAKFCVGIFWGIGDMLNFTAGSRAGFAVSYAIVQVS